MILTIDIKDNQKANVVLEYLKNLNFVTVGTKNDWADSLNSEQISSIDAGLEDLKNKRLSSYADVKEKAKKLIEKKK